MLPSGRIYRGEVVHKRIRPVEHRLSYRVFSLALDVDRLEEVSTRLRFFSLNRFNIFSLNEKDHGHRDGTSLSQFAWQQVRHAGLESTVSRIIILFYPRIWGHAFNPLTVYFCLNEDDQPELMIYEVRNTFGEDLTYVLLAGPQRGQSYTHKIAKELYVSPFNDVEGEYRFHVTPPDREVTVGVALKTANTPLLRTHFRGVATPLTDATLFKMLFVYPLMSLKIVAGIHWEALKLWKKGLRLKTRPPAPPLRILYGTSKESDDANTAGVRQAS